MLAYLAAALCVAQAGAAPSPAVPSAKIGAGAPLIVDSEADPEFELINVRVDVGRIRQVGDALEAELTWTLRSGLLADARATHPDVDIPDASASVSRERIVCRADGALSYAVETRIVAPDGRVLDRRSFDAATARREAEAQERQLARLSPLGAGYGPDPRSLVCRAAARRCDGHAFTWPPPPDLTPLERSARAARMRKDYDATFIPSCRLSS